MRTFQLFCGFALLASISGCTTWNCLASCNGGGTSGAAPICTFSEDLALLLSDAEVKGGCGQGGVLINTCVNNQMPCQ